MTLKQGEDINKKFSSLSDSINSLKDSINQTKLVLSKNILDKNRLDSLLNVSQNKIIVSDNEIKRLNKFIQENDKLYWREKKQWAGWMLLSFVLVVFGFSQ